MINLSLPNALTIIAVLGTFLSILFKYFPGKNSSSENEIKSSENEKRMLDMMDKIIDTIRVQTELLRVINEKTKATHFKMDDVKTYCHETNKTTNDMENTLNQINEKIVRLEARK